MRDFTPFQNDDDMELLKKLFAIITDYSNKNGLNVYDTLIAISKNIQLITQIIKSDENK